MKKTSIKQIWHPYWKWEEIKYNMWGQVADHETYLQKAIEFTGDHKRYGRWMMRVVHEWYFSCEHNLSNVTQNRQAWIGHAAVAMALRCPEDIVREAWWHLTDLQRELANKQADKAINYWERHYEKEHRTKRTRGGTRKS